MADEAKRRSACDRCRGQKLRCVRPSGSTAEPHSQRACERCARAKVQCCTTPSSTRRFLQPIARGRTTTDYVTSTVENGPATTDQQPSNVLGTPDPFAQELELWPDLDLLTTTHPSTTSVHGAMDEGFGLDSMEGDAMDPSTSDLARWLDMNAGVSHLSDAPVLPAEIQRHEDAAVLNIASTPARPQLGSPNQRTPSFRSSNGDNMRSHCSVATQADHVIDPVARSQERIEVYRVQLSELNRRLESNIDSGQLVGAKSMRNATERMLNDAQEFVEIVGRLQSCMHRKCRHGTSSSPQSSHSRAQSNSGTNPNSRGYMTPTSQADPQNQFPTDRHKARGSNSADTSVLDFPSLLCLVSCYTHILQGHDILFTEMLNSLSNCPNINTVSGLAALLPDFSIGRISLNNQPDLKVKSFIHLSSSILTKIEALLGIGVSVQDDPSSQTGLLSTTWSKGVIEALYQQKELGYVKADGTKTARARDTMNSVEKSIDCIYK